MFEKIPKKNLVLKSLVYHWMFDYPSRIGYDDVYKISLELLLFLIVHAYLEAVKVGSLSILSLTTYVDVV